MMVLTAVSGLVARGVVCRAGIWESHTLRVSALTWIQTLRVSALTWSSTDYSVPRSHRRLSVSVSRRLGVSVLASSHTRQMS